MTSKELIRRMFIKLNPEKKVSVKNSTVKYNSSIRILVSNFTLISSTLKNSFDTNLVMREEEKTI